MIKSIEKIKENMDISFFINKIFDIEKIKIILNKEMEFLKDEKPKITLEKHNIINNIVEKLQNNFPILTESQIKNVEGFEKFKENGISNSVKKKNSLTEELPEKKIMILNSNPLEREFIFQNQEFWTIQEEEIEEKKINSIKKDKQSRKKKFEIK